MHIGYRREGDVSRPRLLGDGVGGHGLAGGTALVVTPPSRQGEHAFDALGVCQCGARRKTVDGVVCYLGKHGGGWVRTRPACAVVWQ